MQTKADGPVWVLLVGTEVGGIRDVDELVLMVMLFGLGHGFSLHGSHAETRRTRRKTAKNGEHEKARNVERMVDGSVLRGWLCAARTPIAELSGPPGESTYLDGAQYAFRIFTLGNFRLRMNGLL